jgi:hypothetical protein
LEFFGLVWDVRHPNKQRLAIGKPGVVDEKLLAYTELTTGEADTSKADKKEE